MQMRALLTIRRVQHHHYILIAMVDITSMVASNIAMHIATRIGLARGTQQLLLSGTQEVMSLHLVTRNMQAITSKATMIQIGAAIAHMTLHRVKHRQQREVMQAVVSDLAPHHFLPRTWRGSHNHSLLHLSSQAVRIFDLTSSTTWVQTHDVVHKTRNGDHIVKVPRIPIDDLWIAGTKVPDVQDSMTDHLVAVTDAVRDMMTKVHHLTLEADVYRMEEGVATIDHTHLSLRQTREDKVDRR